MMEYDFEQYEHEENFDDDEESFPFIGQVKNFLMQRENGEFYMKKHEYTLEGVWVETK